MRFVPVVRRPRLLLLRRLLLLLMRIEVASSWHRPVDRPMTTAWRRRGVPVGRGQLLLLSLHGVATDVSSAGGTGGTRISVGATRRGRSGGEKETTVSFRYSVTLHV